MSGTELGANHSPASPGSSLHSGALSVLGGRHSRQVARKAFCKEVSTGAGSQLSDTQGEAVTLPHTPPASTHTLVSCDSLMQPQGRPMLSALLLRTPELRPFSLSPFPGGSDTAQVSRDSSSGHTSWGLPDAARRPLSSLEPSLVQHPLQATVVSKCALSRKKGPVASPYIILKKETETRGCLSAVP